jgi:hypothetical protein
MRWSGISGRANIDHGGVPELLLTPKKPHLRDKPRPQPLRLLLPGMPYDGLAHLE